MDPDNNILKLTKEDYKVTEEELLSSVNSLRIVSEFRTLGCAVSRDLVGYQHRREPGIKICNSPRCMAVAMKKLREGSSAFASNLSLDRQSSQGNNNTNNNVETLREDSSYYSGDVISPVGMGSAATLNMTNAHIGNFEVKSTDSKVSICEILETALQRKLADNNNKKSSVSSCDSLSSVMTVYPEPVSASEPPPAAPPKSKIRSDTSVCGSDYYEQELRSNNSAENNFEEEQQRSQSCDHPDSHVPESAVGTVQRSQRIKEVEKKVWTVKDVQLSENLKNLGACYVSYMWTPNPIKFTLHTYDDLDRITALAAEISQYSEKAPSIDRVPSIGDILFTWYPRDETFYRTEVLSVNEVDKEVEVNFLDYGDAATLTFVQCREPSDEIMKNHPIYGVLFTCTLPEQYRGHPMLNEKLLNDPMKAMLENESFYMKTVQTTGLEWEGTLILENKKHWNTLIVDQLRAIDKEADASKWIEPKKVSSVPGKQQPLAPKSDAKTEGKKVPEPQKVATVPESSIPKSNFYPTEKIKPPPPVPQKVAPLPAKEGSVPKSSAQQTEKKPSSPPKLQKVAPVLTKQPRDLSATAFNGGNAKPHGKPARSFNGDDDAKPFGKPKKLVAPASDRRNLSSSSSVQSAPASSKPSIPKLELSPNLKNNSTVFVNFIESNRNILVSAAEDEKSLTKLTTLLLFDANKAPPLERIPSVSDIVLAPYEGRYYRAMVKSVRGNTVTVDFVDYGDSASIQFSELSVPSEEMLSHPIYGLRLTIPKLSESEAEMDLAGLQEQLDENQKLTLVDYNLGTGEGDLLVNGKQKWSAMVHEEFFNH